MEKEKSAKHRPGTNQNIEKKTRKETILAFNSKIDFQQFYWRGGGIAK